MENPDDNPEQELKQESLPSDSMHINKYMKGLLLESARWMKVLGIVGFVSCAIFVLLGAYYIVAVDAQGNEGSGFLQVQLRGPASSGYNYIFIAVLVFFPSNYLFRTALGITKGLLTGDETALMIGMNNMKSYFKFRGVTAVIGIFILMLLFITISSGLA